MDGRNIRKYFNALIRESNNKEEFFRKAEDFLEQNGFVIWYHFNYSDGSMFGLKFDFDVNIRPYYSVGYCTQESKWVRDYKIYSIYADELKQKIRASKIKKALE
jgi:hypothetical protein